MDKTVAERVLAGVMWLDMVAPDWRTKVRPGYLNMRQPDLCVIGQTFGNYWETLRWLGMRDVDMVAMGFQAKADANLWAGLSRKDYADLETAWRTVLTS